MKNNQARATSPPEPADRRDAPQTAGPPAPALQIAQLTDVGRTRPHNEDYVSHFVPTDPQQQSAKGSLFLVADGMGGHQAGEVASRHAVEMVIQQYYSDTEHDVGSSLVRAFRAANRAIYEQAQADPSRTGMGTTLVAAVILGRKVYLANVGDSRAYMVNRAGIDQITVDHSWVEEQMQAGLLTAEQARRHPQRNLVTRALGSRSSVEVDLFEGLMGEQDTLILCSDGLTTHLEDWELEAAVRQHPPQEAAQLLIDTANKRGGGDNITVLIVAGQKKAALAPAPAVAGAPRRALPLIPIVVAFAAVLVLAGVGLLVVPSLLTGKATPTDTAMPTQPSEVPTQTPAATQTALPAQAPSLTETLQATQMVSPTATLASTWTPTGTATPTATPTPEPTATPTSTPEPTVTESVVPTTPTVSAVLTSVPGLPSPVPDTPPPDDAPP
jgi:serine/threonine protein phosphatase PrpC